MALPRIPAQNPITISAVPEKTYPELILTGFRIAYVPGVFQHLAIFAHPYNYDTQEVLPQRDAVVAYETTEMTAQLQRVPALSTAVAELKRVGGLLLYERTLLDQIKELTADPEDPPDPQVLADLQAALADVRIQLGIT
jgi:hypothetical protein